MRGKAFRSLWRKVQAGITPAHAGKRAHRLRDVRIWEDHPRACGEKCIGVLCVRKRSGSPPRMRGKVEREERARSLRRITPAHAGKSPAVQATAPGE